MRAFPLKLEQKAEVSALTHAIAIALALLASFVVAGGLIRLARGDVIDAFTSLFEGAYGDRRAFLESLLRASPLLLTGVATVVAFRARVWSIGQEGQLYAGALMSYWMFLIFKDVLPRAPLLIVIIMAGFVGGALLGLLAGWMKTRFNVDIIISTVFLNYIILYLVSLLIYDQNLWMDKSSYYPRTAQLPEFARYPTLLEGYRLHIGIIIAVISALIVYWLIKRTPLGLDIRALGANPTASEFRGINTNRVLIIVMIISGGIAGLAGTGEVFGVHHRVTLDISPGYGYTGIIVAMLADLNPLLVIPTAIFFGGLINGSLRLLIAVGVPTSLIKALQAIILIFLLAARVLAKYRVRRVHYAE